MLCVVFLLGSKHKTFNTLYIELGNKSSRVFVSNLNGLKISRYETNSFIKRVEKPRP